MPELAERFWSAADVRALPEDGKRYECIGGELLVTPAPRAVHQRAVRDLARTLDAYVALHGLGDFFFSPADVELQLGTLVQPDIFVALPRPGLRTVREWTDIAGLLLAVEILSPATARYDRVVKRAFYQRAGVTEYWIVDLDARLIERWRPEDTGPEILTARLEWCPTGAATPLALDLEAFFAALLDR